ncbi:hypothetical protein WDZ92_00550 [Nostoc sp. NIES-2111]
MKSLHTLLILLVLVLGLSAGRTYGQATVYLADNSRVPGQIEMVTPREVKVIPTNQTEVQTIERAKVLALFNSKGDFLLLDSGSKAPDSVAVRRFLHPDEQDLEADIIIARNGKSVVAHITGEDMNKVYYEARGGVRFDAEKPKLAAVVRKDGRHQVFGPMAPVLPALRTASADMPKLREEAKTMKLVKIKEGDAELPFDKNLFERKILQKVDDLGRYVRIIADKQTPLDEANRTINLACGLFLDEERLVEVSQPNKASEIYKVRQYLNKLKLLRYQDVRVSWYNVSFVSKMRLGPDGRYYATVSFDQKFEGFQEGKLVYSDKVRKNIEVIIDKYKKMVDGVEQEGWEVYLSDIGVKRSV